ncbi:5'-3' exoribonuclease 2 [Nematocida displodere]|uniref:5'-3' exoribonuclease n=1 Tax=Nematocida displodere TaxID=1805483 RepID=A0A177EBL2_9MICR|nr:5'-3' exoribonuclease 2 [Nematocida displodere]
MGVPSLFRWVARKYARSLSKVADQEVDNLYLDLNGIIHPCCHPTNKPAPANEAEMFIEIFRTIDHLVDLVRPKQLLYIAVDGVAPRAKMNQQRERRFKTGDDAAAKNEQQSVLAEKFDSNTITPGTPFMFRLHQSLISYVESRMASSRPAWKSLAVIYSGCDVPGEGEHKVYDFVRNIKGQDVRHAICGLDADLIFLSLSTHEGSFKVLREDVFWIEREEKSECPQCKVVGHSLGNCIPTAFPPYVYLDIGVLRGYLQKEFEKAVSLGANFDRMLDDWIFVCFFVGNDFLPSIPSMDIKVNAIETITASYITGLVERHRYLTDNGKIYMPELAQMMQSLSNSETALLKAKLNTYVRTAKRRGEVPREEDLRMKLYEAPGRSEYYAKRLHARNPAEINDVCKEYVRGLAWVLQYYNRGCPSWNWYYPLHFAPLAEDIATMLKNTPDLEFVFERGHPRRPLEQIMAVLPPSSSASIPEGLHRIFTEIPENYPTEIEVDMFGKTQAWQGVALLPFLNYEKLVSLVRTCVNELPISEIQRNVEGSEVLLLPLKNPNFPAAESIYSNFLKPSGLRLLTPYYSGKIGFNSESSLPGLVKRVEVEKEEYTVSSLSVLFVSGKN